MRLTAEDLHAAADLLSDATDEAPLIDEYGLTVDELAQFIDAAAFLHPDGHVIGEVTPLGIALGVSIGLVAARRAA